MNSAFGRVFSVLVMVLLILLALALGGFGLAERVREMAHWDARLDQLSRVLRDHPAVDGAEWQSSSAELMATVHTLSSLPAPLQQRLKRQSAVAQRESGMLSMWMYLEHENVLQLPLGDRADRVIHCLSHVLDWHWQETGLTIEQYAQWLRPRLPIYFLASEPSELAPFLVVDDGRFLVVGDESFWQHQYSGWVTVFVSLYALAGLALVVYRQVSLIEGRLNTLDQATRRLAQGHLSARVVVRGQDPVSRLGTSFNKTAEHINRLLDIQREMVRAVSHELRTPISRMTFALESLSDMTAEQPVVQRSIQNMDGDLQELEQLVDEILTYARLEEGGPLLEFERTSLEAIARQVVSEACPSGNIQVTFDGTVDYLDALAELEPRYLHRAVQNLVGNACRYARSRVIVSCEVTEETCRVNVEDDGPGVPEADWGRVFMAFARLDDSRTRTSGGFGLGLSIVRRIAYWHGGRAIVGRSETLSGARFSLVWPRYQQDDV